MIAMRIATSIDISIATSAATSIATNIARVFNPTRNGCSLQNDITVAADCVKYCHQLYLATAIAML